MADAKLIPEKQAIALLTKLEKLKYNKAQLIYGLLTLFNKEALYIAGFIVRHMLSGQRKRIRTGSLARSIVGASALVNGMPGFRVGVLRGPSLKYAGVQEYGTKGKEPTSPYDTIRPVNAKALAIPVGPRALTPAGVSRFPSARDYPGKLVPIYFHKGGRVIGALFDENDLDKANKKGGGFYAAKATYLLMTSVDITPGHFIHDGVRQNLPLVVLDLVGYLRSLLTLAQNTHPPRQS